MRSAFTGLLRAIGLATAIAASGCAGVDTTPINFVSNQPPVASPDYIPDPGDDGTTVVALSFSGGGVRAAALAYGVLSELDALVIDVFPYRRTLLDNVRTVAGTSGGAVMAAYLGYRGKDGYQDFRERFLYQNPESSMVTAVMPGTLIKAALGGGANDRNSFARWLDENLFDHATFSAFRKPDRPIVWITASDIYNNTPFLFTEDTFAALCSDIGRLKIAEAVGASAAFPVAFAPMILKTPAIDCGYRRPAWLQRALDAQNRSIRLDAYARSLDSYQSDPNLDFVRLLDGGLTDNLGITGLTLERAKATTPYSPLSPRQAVRLRNFVFIVTDAGKRDRAGQLGHQHNAADRGDERRRSPRQRIGLRQIACLIGPRQEQPVADMNDGRGDDPRPDGGRRKGDEGDYRQRGAGHAERGQRDGGETIRPDLDQRVPCRMHDGCGKHHREDERRHRPARPCVPAANGVSRSMSMRTGKWSEATSPISAWTERTRSESRPPTKQWSSRRRRTSPAIVLTWV